jgi:hypothetical protein
MVVWGGFNSTEMDDGAAYNPESDTWSALPSVALLPRQLFAMVWTGDQAVVWAGRGPQGDGTQPQASHDDGAVLRLRS